MLLLTQVLEVAVEVEKAPFFRTAGGGNGGSGIVIIRYAIA